MMASGMDAILTDHKRLYRRDWAIRPSLMTAVLSSYGQKFSVARQHSDNEQVLRSVSSTCSSEHVIIGAPKEKNVRHDYVGLRRVWSDGDASSGHAGSGASLPRMCAKGEKRGQTSSSRKEVGRAKSNPRTRVVGFVGPICRLPHSYFPSAFFQIKSPRRNRGIRTSRVVVLNADSVVRLVRGLGRPVPPPVSCPHGCSSGAAAP
jgi:hypothetical protein